MKILLVIMTLFLSFFLSIRGYAMNCSESMVEAHAIQEIEYLRRWYAKATDQIGIATLESIAEGRKIYRRVFTPEAQLDAGPGREPQVGPEAWVDLVVGALGELGPTQHLIGTQLVEFKSLDLDGACNVISGRAHMESYVQAWHERRDEKVWLFLGTYFDEVVFIPGVGWRIEKMKLQQVAGETRYMDTFVGRTQK